MQWSVRCLSRLLCSVLLACSVSMALAAPRIHVVTEETPWAFMRQGQVSGSATEVVRQTLQRAGLPYQIDLYPWARAYEMAQGQANVLIYLIARTPAREAQFKWVGEVVRYLPSLYQLKEAPPLTIRHLADARQYTIGVVRDDVSQQYLQQQGFTRLIIASSGVNNVRRLLQHQVQLVPLLDEEPAVYCAQLRIDCRHLQRVYPLQGLSSELYMAYSLATPDDVVARSRQAFAALKKAGTLQKIMATP